MLNSIQEWFSCSATPCGSDESLIAFGVPSFAAFNKLLMNGGLNDVAPV
jgi:hypothetical protein